jgi:hypothetical protein
MPKFMFIHLPIDTDLHTDLHVPLHIHTHLVVATFTQTAPMAMFDFLRWHCPFWASVMMPFPLLT